MNRNKSVPYSDKTLIEKKHKELGLRPTSDYDVFSSHGVYPKSIGSPKCNIYLQDYLNAIQSNIIPETKIIQKEDKNVKDHVTDVFRYARSVFGDNEDRTFDQIANPETRPLSIFELRKVLSKNPNFTKVRLPIEQLRENDVYLSKTHGGIIVNNPRHKYVSLYKKHYPFKKVTNFIKPKNYVETIKSDVISKFLDRLSNNDIDVANPYLLRSANQWHGARDVYLNPEMGDDVVVYRPKFKKEK
jgi:hypothetical protein